MFVRVLFHFYGILQAVVYTANVLYKFLKMVIAIVALTHVFNQLT